MAKDDWLFKASLHQKPVEDFTESSHPCNRNFFKIIVGNLAQVCGIEVASLLHTPYTQNYPKMSL